MTASSAINIPWLTPGLRELRLDEHALRAPVSSPQPLSPLSEESPQLFSISPMARRIFSSVSAPTTPRKKRTWTHIKSPTPSSAPVCVDS
ncbi:MAG: hypothetical protein KGJ02_03305 [Verrucomicrobiota bacterium]|nr:hypothetical protein [Verrucomicrobiota bacterium]